MEIFEVVLPKVEIDSDVALKKLQRTRNVPHVIQRRWWHFRVKGHFLVVSPITEKLDWISFPHHFYDHFYEEHIWIVSRHALSITLQVYN